MKTILYAEDDHDDYEFFVSVINHINPKINCIRAEDCSDVIEILQDIPALPDYIFLDINMPKLNGIDCLVKVVSDKRYNSIPVIMYSTGTSPSEVLKCKELGATDYLFKAFSFKEAVTDLERYLA